MHKLFICNILVITEFNLERSAFQMWNIPHSRTLTGAMFRAIFPPAALPTVTDRRLRKITPCGRLCFALLGSYTILHYRWKSCEYPILLSLIFVFFREDFLPGHEFSHDILCRRAAMTTAEPPEPLTFSVFRIHFIQTIPSVDWRPGGEAFWCVLCVLWTEISCEFVWIRGS